MQKVMVTLPEEMVRVIDTVARELGETRSKFTRQALMARVEQHKKQKFEALLAEGYQIMAEENLADAQAYTGALFELGER